MVVCPACGFENPEQARFCAGCGRPLEAPAAVRETRKTVTIVFCDVTGSTALGERLDPESLRHVMARYFEAMRAAIEGHGGTVEKFIGDAVMAVFGVPVVHEDDALRAVRAAVDMREALAVLNVELERDYGTRLEARIGINTGAVVTGTAERLATGDAVNVAARLEQAARPGEILIGRETWQLTRDAVEVDDLDALELKGKAESVAAYRLVSAGGESPARRLGTPMVGRQRELRMLNDAWDRAVSERSCVLFTLLGAAGVGKSRLTAEFLAGLDATIVQGRCLSYGEGITYWPVTEVALQLNQLGYDTSAGPVAGLLGEPAPATSPEEIALAVRRLLEQAAADRPLVVLFDDCHWGEPTFLELVEHAATMSRGAPILLFCAARPELLDRKPDWAGGLLNATTVLLQPLSPDETDELIASHGGLDGELAARVRVAAEGNPLFVEEMLAMVEEGGGGDVVVPPTVQALLAARLDQLDPGERGVLERGAVEGHVFHRGAVQALGTAEAEITPGLTALVRKELVWPEQATYAGDDAYRFRHILIRDAAYDALPKATRAELHERFADWLDERGVDLIERDEIVGYHLEQAHRYRAELGPADDAARALGARAAERLVSAARTAQLRRDHRAAASLLGRASALLSGEARREVELDLVRVLFETGEFDRAGALIEGVRGTTDDEGLAARGQLEALMLRTLAGGVGAAFTPEEFDGPVAVLERVGDEVALAHALSYRGRVRFYVGDCAKAELDYARSVELAHRHGLLNDEQEAREMWAAAKRYGPSPVDDAVRFADELISDLERVGSPTSRAALVKAGLLAMRGDIEAARAVVRSVEADAPEQGIIANGMLGMEGGEVELLAGDPVRAAVLLRGSWDRLGALGETGFRATTGTMLAEALLAAGDEAEAEAILAETETFTGVGDFDPEARLRWVRAAMLARRGAVEEAERLAREAVELVRGTDYLDIRADAHAGLAKVLEAAGKSDEAGDEWQAALALYEQKGNVVRAAEIREKIG